MNRRLLALLSLAISSAAAAQQPLVLEKLRGWDASTPAPAAPLVTAEIMKAAVATQKRAGGCLPAATIIDATAPATGVRFVLSGIVAGQIKNGWTVTVRHPNCGPEQVRYALVRRADDKLHAFRINRGRSLANESLIGDTLPLATLSAVATLKRNGVDCTGDNAALGVTRVVDEAEVGPEIYGIRHTGSWSEVWPVTLCGRTAEVMIRFTADGDGGAFNDIKGNKVKLLPATT